MIKAAHVTDGRVTNVSLWESADDLPEGLIALTDEQVVGPGFTVVDGVFVAPPPPPEIEEVEEVTLETLVERVNTLQRNIEVLERIGRAPRDSE